MFSGVLDRAPICAQISSRCSLGMKAHAYCMFLGILVFQFPQSGQGDSRSDMTCLLLLRFAWLFRIIWKGFWLSNVRIVCSDVFDMVKVAYLQKLSFSIYE